MTTHNRKAMNMIRKLVTLIIIASMALGFYILGTAAAQGAPDNKVTLCHATASDENPWVEITVNENALGAHKIGEEFHGVDGRVDFLVTEDTPCPPVTEPDVPPPTVPELDTTTTTTIPEDDTTTTTETTVDLEVPVPPAPHTTVIVEVQPELPYTGVNVPVLVGLGASLLATGGLILRRRDG